MYRIAVIQFPGTNCEYEAYRAVKRAGLTPQFFRWNQPLGELAAFDGYFIPGGFSYEDRIRSGAIAARDPLMHALRPQAEAGKPVLGICNGAQILVEAGFIPGLSSYHPGASLAANERGYLNFWVHIKNDVEPGRSAFNGFTRGHRIRLPIAHGEGRYVIPEELLRELEANGQTVFRYCNALGEVRNEYPVNPNGAVSNLAGVCNPVGNVLALMPHPERTPQGQVLFESLRVYLERGATVAVAKPLSFQAQPEPLVTYEKPMGTLEILVELIITDNEAETLAGALKQLGYGPVSVRRYTHWELGVAGGVAPDLIQQIIDSGELLNTNKECAYVEDRSPLTPQAHTVLVRDRLDSVGQGKCRVLQHRFGFAQVTAIKRGVVWQVVAGEADWQRLFNEQVLWNPFAQEAQLIT